MRPAGAQAAVAAATTAASGWAVRISFPPPRPRSPPAVSSAWRPRLRSGSPPCRHRPLLSPPIHVPARGTPWLLLPGGRAFGRAAGRGPGRRGRRLSGAAAAPAAAPLAPGRAAAPSEASLLGHGRRGASRAAGALLPPGRRRLHRRCCSRLCAAAGSSVVVARATAADPGLLHGGTQLRGAVAEQLPAGEELLPVLGWLLGKCLARPSRLGKAHPETRDAGRSPLLSHDWAPRAAGGQHSLSSQLKLLGNKGLKRVKFRSGLGCTWAVSYLFLSV